MLDSVDDLAYAVAGTLLEGRSIDRVAVPNTDESAFFIACDGAEARHVWLAGMGLRDATHRYPVLTYAVDGFESVLRGGWHPSKHASPSYVIDRATSIDVDEMLAQRDQQSWDTKISDAADLLVQELATTRRVFTTAPELSTALGAVGGRASRRDVQRYLFDWERQNVNPLASPEVMSNLGLPTFDPAGDPRFPYFVCFLPTELSWQVPAYIGYFGADGREADFCAAARRWESRNGALFMLVGGVTADLVVSSPPASPDEAWELARELVLFGGSFQGTLRWLAEALPVADEWHLFERP